MKILHTADWHLGHQLYNYDRSDEFTFFFDQLIDIIQKEKPDAMIVAGDIFDRSNPTIQSQELYNKQLMRINHIAPQMTIVIIAGNHDSRPRLELHDSLWKYVNVHVIGTFRKDNNGELDLSRHIIEVKDKQTHLGTIIALPHCFSSNIPGEDPSHEVRLQSLITSLVDKAIALYETNDVVCTAHLTLKGKMTEIGNDEAVSSEIFDQRLSYTALGHIHNHKFLGTDKVVYAGTPVATAFDESFTHRVVIAETQPNDIPIIKEYPIEQLRPLITVNKEPLSSKEIMECANELDKTIPCYIKFIKADDGNLNANMINELSTHFADCPTRFCTVELERRRNNNQDNQDNAMDFSSFKKESPIEIAKRYYKEKTTNQEMPKELEKRLSQVLHEIETEEE